MVSDSHFFNEVDASVKPALLRFLNAKYGRKRLYDAAFLEAKLDKKRSECAADSSKSIHAILSLFEEKKRVCD